MQVFETYISRLGPVGPRKFYVSLQVFHCCHRAFKALEMNAKFIAFNIIMSLHCKYSPPQARKNFGFEALYVQIPIGKHAHLIQML